MQYSDLPPHMKQAIDTIHQAIMRHKRSMLSLQAMAPQMLLPGDQGLGHSTTESPSSRTPLINEELNRLHIQLNRLQSDVETLQLRARQQKDADENLLLQSIMYAKWPVEALAHRKGIRLTAMTANVLQEEKKEDNLAADVQSRVRESLDRAMSSVDRIEKMPSPYLWHVIHDMEIRLQNLDEQSSRLMKQLDQSAQLEQDLQMYQNPLPRVAEIVETHHQALWQLTSRLDHIRSEMELIRYRYRYLERGENVLDKVAAEEYSRQRKLDEEIQLQVFQAPQAGNAAAPLGSSALAANPSPGPSSSFSFSGLGAPAPSTGASSTAFSFSSGPGTNAPAPSSTSGGTAFSFSSGATPSPAAPAPAFGQPAPASGQPAPAFGQPSPAFGQPAPAPTFGGGVASPAPSAFGFNAAAISTPAAKKKTTRSSSRLKR